MRQHTRSNATAYLFISVERVIVVVIRANVCVLCTYYLKCDFTLHSASLGSLQGGMLDAEMGTPRTISFAAVGDCANAQRMNVIWIVATCASEKVYTVIADIIFRTKTPSRMLCKLS